MKNPFVSSGIARYKPLAADNIILTEENSGEQEPRGRGKALRRLLLFALVVAALIALVLFRVEGPGTRKDVTGIECTDFATRQEWRSLSTEEKLEYIDAVNCLRQKPSRLALPQSLYDDFPYVHAHYGESSHDTASFLTWHRYFIHIFEQALKEECDYLGHLTYWDWTLDWYDIRKAPIWDDQLGFGGDGSGVGKVILNGTCVTTGPFANLEVKYLKKDATPHCLSRGFAPTDAIARYRSWISPTAVGRLMHKDDYEDFNLALEHAGHNAVPYSIRGDFLVFTAPYDPVFFLHHTQLDRVWFHWQQTGRGRTRKYNGRKPGDLDERVSDSDLISMGGLAPDVHVSDILDTRGSLLCYNYL